jgi:hypothetical protein
MDRTEYLQMAQKISVLKSGVCDIKQNIPDDLKVVYNDIIYYPLAYELSFDKGYTVHKVILHELNSNSIVYAKLDKLCRFDKSK